MAAKFQLGKIAATPGAIESLRESGQDGTEFVRRHVQGDFGKLDEYDVQVNLEAIRDGGRVFSAYTTLNGRDIWVITEADRSVTTLLLPDEY
jgi:hypothetical protein